MEDDKKQSENAANGASFLSKMAQGASSVMEAASDIAPVLVPFTNFLPLIKEIGNIFDEIIDLVEAAEHNKRTCKILKKRVDTAESAVRDLKRDREDKKDFFTSNNYLHLQNLSNIATRIKDFISEISQMKTLVKYFKAKIIEKTFTELCEEFDSCVNLLSFSITVEIADELKELKADQEDFAKYLQEMIAGIKTEVEDIGVNVKDIGFNMIDIGVNVKDIGVNVKEVRDDVNDVGDNVKEVRDDVKDLRDDVKEIKDYFSKVVQVNAMNNTMEKYMNETSQNQKEIDKIFQVHNLKISDYERDDIEEPRKNGRVTKWCKITNKGAEFAFKTISEKEDQKIVQNQVTILKELHDWQNIIKFYGITSDGNKWYLVTEWAECGNLREFYQNKNDFDLKLKLRISLDIARGLNFLRTVEIVHRDIRAENILITLNETAKLANFKLSRYLTDATKKQSQNLERVRYCAPELLERAPNYKYDQKCEVYSFGILLWEIAEERIPYQGNDDILDITNKVRNKMYREPFSETSQMPEKFKQLEIEAVHHDPTFRPKITKMFEVLRDCVKNYSSKRHLSSQDSSSSSSLNLSGKPSTPKPTPKREFSIDTLPDFESFKYMTIADAAKQHKKYRNGKIIGDVKTAYKCFEAYANSNKINITNRSNQIKAKYYKALYISKGLVEGPPNKDKIVAELYKEVADDEVNEFPEAKVRYGDCLCYGRGVEQDVPEALKYFEKAADDGVKVAMYNVGNMYYNGIGCTTDTEKAIRYMKLAVYNCYEPAIEFCKEHNIIL